MNGPEEARERYEVAMNSRPVNEKEMAEAHNIDVILQSSRGLREDEIQALVYTKASLENSGWVIPPRY